jgi:hypothetical protein
VTITSNQLVSFGEDARGCVYVAAQTGKVYRFQSPSGAAPCPAGSGGGGGGGGGGTPTGLSLALSGQRHQPAVSRKALRVGVRCNKPCLVRAHTLITFGWSAKRLKLKGVTKSVAANAKGVVVIAVPRSKRRALSRRLRGGRTALAKVTLSAQDIGGGLRRGTRRVRVVG